jgi:RNA polymerase sigma-70 factor, ECF subfamily
MTSRPISLPIRESFVSKAETIQSTTAALDPIVSDEQLLRLVAEQCGDAFTQLFDRHYALVRAIARRVLQNPADAADAIQETFMDMLQNAETFNPSRGAFKSWLSSLTYHRCFKILRALRNRECESVDPDLLSSALGSDHLPDRLIRSVDFRKGLAVVLERLNEGERKTLELHFFEGLKTKEIASRLGESIGNIYHYFYRGLSKLRSELVKNDLLDGYTEYTKHKQHGR